MHSGCKLQPHFGIRLCLQNWIWGLSDFMRIRLNCAIRLHRLLSMHWSFWSFQNCLKSCKNNGSLLTNTIAINIFCISIPAFTCIIVLWMSLAHRCSYIATIACWILNFSVFFAVSIIFPQRSYEVFVTINVTETRGCTSCVFGSYRLRRKCGPHNSLLFLCQHTTFSLIRSELMDKKIEKAGMESVN